MHWNYNPENTISAKHQEMFLHVNNSKLEKKYNKLVEKYKFCNDEEIIKFIDNILVKLWRQRC